MMNINSSTSVMPVLPPLADRRVTDLLARRAAGQADETFIVLPHERETWTFGSLWESATRLATGLRSLGLGPGDKCAIILPNSAEYLLTWFASMIIGSVDASISGGLHGALLAHQLRIASVKVAICDDETRRGTVLDPPQGTAAGSICFGPRGARFNQVHVGNDRAGKSCRHDAFSGYDCGRSVRVDHRVRSR